MELHTPGCYCYWFPVTGSLARQRKMGEETHCPPPPKWMTRGEDIPIADERSE